MSERKQAEQSTPRNQPPRREKKPLLTHFLCFPLVNAVSLPQLESSLATFKAAIPPRPRTENDHPLKPTPPLIPDAALRPVGTLHLTLGVMSLPTQERLEQAVNLLQSLDLASMLREAEVSAASQRQQQQAGRPTAARKVTPVNPATAPAEPPAPSEVKDDVPSVLSVQPDITSAPPVTLDPPQPLTISLESLHALPRAKASTVLYAAPLDPTSRLYPFSVMLRDKFLEAGFLEGEYIKAPAKRDRDRESQEQNKEAEETKEGVKKTEAESAEATTPTIPQPLVEELPPGVAADPQPHDSNAKLKLKTNKAAPKLKLRPLLLHATVVNTIYVRGRRRGNNGNDPENNNNKNGKKNNNNNGGRYTFDARDILAHYRDYYVDETRTEARPMIFPRPVEEINNGEDRSDEEDLASSESEAEEVGQKRTNHDDTAADAAAPPPPEKRQKKKQKADQDEPPKNPFIWARDVPIDRLCICEMGAKKVESDDAEVLRLGEVYKVIAERRLDFGRAADVGGAAEHERMFVDDIVEISSDSSVDGGVRVDVG
ncbi:hypothetical protein VTN00DRAFT_10189 [Thermoascus crustaceus]|uniref:uncharacterized protein n=1 Tax=Thermoascus crustaceus TaxID=5088 RepID=UPI0037447A88